MKGPIIDKIISLLNHSLSNITDWAPINYGNQFFIPPVFIDII